jgi:hypothetical protein
MRQLKRGLGFLALAGGVAFAMPAVATQWLSSGAVGTGPTPQMSMTVGGQTVLVRAYSTKTASTTSSTASNGLFQTANLFKYSGGFGITNTVGSADAYEGTQPEHAIDNNQIFDVLVFELPLAGMDLEAFRLGWASEVSAPDQTVNNHADIKAYFGGNNLAAGYNFANTCFTGCATPLATGTGNLGFVDLNPLITVSNPSDPTGGNNVPSGTDVTIAGAQSGRYLVMSGALGGTNDNFKVNMIQATGTTTQTPEPGTLALMALGLFGLVALKRRRALA